MIQKTNNSPNEYRLKFLDPFHIDLDLLHAMEDVKLYGCTYSGLQGAISRDEKVYLVMRLDELYAFYPVENNDGITIQLRLDRGIILSPIRASRKAGG